MQRTYAKQIETTAGDSAVDGLFGGPLDRR